MREVGVLTYFTVSSVLPRINGSTIGMGLALTQALAAARATNAPQADRTVGELATENVIVPTLVGRAPVAGRALLDILV